MNNDTASKSHPPASFHKEGESRNPGGGSAPIIDMTMFHQAFFDEATDLLAEFEHEILRLEDEPDDRELLNTIFRCAHSIKGGAATFGFTDIAGFTHGLETLLDKVRNGEIEITRSLTQLLFECLDQLKDMLAVAKGDLNAAPDTASLTARLESFSSAQGIADNKQPGSSAHLIQAVTAKDGEIEGDGDNWGVWQQIRRYRLVLKPGTNILQTGTDPLNLIKQIADKASILSVSCDTVALPGIDAIDPESFYLSWVIELETDASQEEILEIFEFIADDSEIHIEPLKQQESSADSQLTDTKEPSVTAIHKNAPAAPVTRTENKSSETQTLRVTTDKVDKLINLVGELVINQSMLNEVAYNFSMDKLPRLLETVAQMERASRELQERVMAVRMLPMKHAFGRFPRLVRDTAAACSKQIDLVTSGEETELDKTMIEALTDPLTHLIRNSIDHGIETPAERIAANKQPAGVIHLSASQEGGMIVIVVSDDGRGLDTQRIHAKAIANHIIDEDEQLSDEQINNLIFQPGFSTAEQVTDLSGRGVGMDIVAKTVQVLGGSVAVSTIKGQGTTFRIRLPLTMAILEGLSVAVGNEVYVLPLTSIVESIQPKSGDINLVAGSSEVVRVRDKVLPVLRLADVFNVEGRTDDPTQALLVIIENEHKRLALMVDELVTQSQVVIKSIETNYHKVNGIAGATILGDGRVALILDVPALIRKSRAECRV